MKSPTPANLQKIVAAALVIACLLFFGVDLFSGKTVTHAGTITGKVHIPARTYMQPHTRTDSKGRTVIYYTTVHDPAQWYLYVESLDGRLMAVDCRPELFYTKQNGQVVPYLVTYGRFTGIPYFPRATNQPTHNYASKNTHHKSQTQTY